MSNWIPSASYKVILSARKIPHGRVLSSLSMEGWGFRAALLFSVFPYTPATPRFWGNRRAMQGEKSNQETAGLGQAGARH
jgi:hypothetical protein